MSAIVSSSWLILIQSPEKLVSIERQSLPLTSSNPFHRNLRDCAVNCVIQLAFLRPRRELLLCDLAQHPCVAHPIPDRLNIGSRFANIFHQLNVNAEILIEMSFLSLLIEFTNCFNIV